MDAHPDQADEADSSEVDLWSEQGAQRFIATSDALADAIRAHARALTENGRRFGPEVFGAERALLPALRERVEAHFAYTHCVSLLAGIDAIWDDEEVQDDDVGGVAREAGGHVAVLRREDFEVVDEGAVLAAGRAAYLRAWPDDDDEAAARDVTGLGRAMYQLAHADGWDSLAEAPGLEMVGATTWVVTTEAPLLGESEDWPQEPFTVEGTPLYSQNDVYLD